MAKAVESVKRDFYLALSFMAWGKGDTQEEAVKNCKKEIVWTYLKKGVKEVNVYVFRCPPESEAYIDGMGNICWKLGHQPEELPPSKVPVPSRWRN